MQRYEEVLEQFAAAAKVPSDDVLAHERLRNRVADALTLDASVLRLVDVGSFRHGTAVRGASRFDVLVVLQSGGGGLTGGARTKSLARALQSIHSSVQDALPNLHVTSMPDSVFVDALVEPGPGSVGDDGDSTSDDSSGGNSIAGGSGGSDNADGGTGGGDNAGEGGSAARLRLRLIPAFEAPGEAGSADVSVPDAARKWVLTRPNAREQLIARIDDGRLRDLIRLVLYWKYANSVPISSYYLETAVIRQSLRQPSFDLLWDLCWLFEQTALDDLMNLPDLSSPSQVQRVRPTDTLARRIEAQVPLDRAAANARAAISAYLDDAPTTVAARLTALFAPSP